MPTASNTHSRAQRLRPQQSVLLGSLIFGLFFGAGNLIFPISLGLQAGSSVVPAVVGFLLAAVGLPILGVLASATSAAPSIHALASRVSPAFALVFTVALYLTIGPFFAIPRTATVSYEIAFGSSVDGPAARWALLAFTAVFFIVTFAAALRPGKIIDYVGRYLTPLFLVLLTILLIVAFLSPAPASPSPLGAYATNPLAFGVLDGYNTMDALSSLAFAIVIIHATRSMGVESSGGVAREIARASVLAAVGMGAIYVSLAVLGAQSTGIVPRDANGAVALSAIADHHVGPAGQVLAALIMLVACVKTAIGLVTATAEMFAELFPRPLSQARWTLLFILVSLAVANVGLETIIEAAVPVLQLLYPVAIAVILTGLLHHWVHDRPRAYPLIVVPAAAVSVLTVVAQVPYTPAPLRAIAEHCGAFLPGFELGFGWMLPTAIGVVVGLLSPRRAEVSNPPQPARTSG